MNTNYLRSGWSLGRRDRGHGERIKRELNKEEAVINCVNFLLQRSKNVHFTRIIKS